MLVVRKKLHSTATERLKGTITRGCSNKLHLDIDVIVLKKHTLIRMTGKKN